MKNNDILFKKMNKIFHEDGNIFHIYKESIAEFDFKCNSTFGLFL
jgi:hypothetical protein